MKKMKIFVVSDTHGSVESFLEKIETMEKPDLIIHLGDYVRDGVKIEEITGIETIIAKGNGDYFETNYNYDELIIINDKRIFLTHGHKYNIRYDIDNLIYKGEELEADLILFGHTHVPLLFEEDNKLIMNPGSPNFPRDYARRKTFGIIEIEEEKIKGKLIELN